MYPPDFCMKNSAFLAHTKFSYKKPVFCTGHPVVLQNSGNKMLDDCHTGRGTVKYMSFCVIKANH